MREQKDNHVHRNCAVNARKLLDELIRQCENGKWHGKFGVEFSAADGVINCVREKSERTVK